MENLKKFYIAEGKEQTGPFSLVELKQKNLDLSTRVWYEGLSEWRQLDTLADLSELLGLRPPAFADEPPVTKVEQVTVIIPGKSKHVVVKRDDDTSRRNGPGNSSLTFGILGFLFSLPGYTFFFSWTFILISIITGLVAVLSPKWSKCGVGTATAGLVLSGIAIIWLIYFLSKLIDNISGWEDYFQYL